MRPSEGEAASGHDRAHPRALLRAPHPLLMQRTKFLLAALAASLLLSSVNGPDALPRARKLGKEQKVDEYGYAIRIIERWASIPQKAEQTQIVGSWKPEMKAKGDSSGESVEGIPGVMVYNFEDREKVGADPEGRGRQGL